ncbi:MAG: glutathione S-transferase family protein [Pseudomonadota bacterium]
MNKSIELHGARTGNCLRVSIALEEAEIFYTVVLMDLSGGQQRDPAHLALNPAGKVPTIIDRSGVGPEFVLSQSNAILFYLAEKAPGKLLAASDLRQKAIAYERFFYFLTDVIALSHDAFRLRNTKGGSGSEALDLQALSMLKAAERFLLESTFMAGNSFTLADIAALTITLAYEREINWDQSPRMSRWFEAVMARPAVQRGLKAFNSP